MVYSHLMRLTSKQERFIASYKITENAKQSAINAGYSVKSAEQIGSQLIHNPRIVAELDAWRASKREEVTKEDYIDLAMKDYRSLDAVEPNKPRFLEIAGKTLGYIGSNSDQKGQTINNLTQINISGGESQSQIWDLTRKLLGNDA